MKSLLHPRSKAQNSDHSLQGRKLQSCKERVGRASSPRPAIAMRNILRIFDPKTID